MPYPKLDPSRLSLRPLRERKHDFGADQILPLAEDSGWDSPALGRIARRIRAARRDGRPVILLMGAHVLRAGVQRFLIDWMQRGLVTHLGMNGGAAIHDYELSLVGGTTESVAHYIKNGQFGFWEETGRVNDVAVDAADRGIGLGEALGEAIASGNHEYSEISVLCQAHRLRIPATVHVGIGYDIVHQHPNSSGAATGAASYTDFLVLGHAVSRPRGRRAAGGWQRRHGTGGLPQGPRHGAQSRRHRRGATSLVSCARCLTWLTSGRTCPGSPQRRTRVTIFARSKRCFCALSRMAGRVTTCGVCIKTVL